MTSPLNRRHFFAGAATAVAAASVSRVALAALPEAVQQTSPDTAAPWTPPGVTGAGRPYNPVVTLNGWTLPWRMKNGVKEFHLVAEPVVREVAPGFLVNMWGYNGQSPGPTIEVVEGDKVRIFVTNRLPEHTTIHWHGQRLPNGMDGVGGLNQPQIPVGKTFVYEFTARRPGTFMYHPHADEMVQMAMGMMGLLIIHPKAGDHVDRDFALLLHNFALHPGTYRPDPAVMQDFDLWTFNSKVFPAIEPMVARTGERVRIRVGNLSMWNHPIHLHGVQFEVTGSDGGRWPKAQWRREVTEIVGVGQMRDIEFTAVPGDWAFHCHMSHHTMGPMGHDIPNTLGVDQSGVEEKIRRMLPGYMAMGQDGMSEHQDHTDSGHMKGPENTLAMMAGKGPFGNIEMGGMFTVVKVRDDIAPGDFSDPGWYRNPPGTVASRVSTNPDFGAPVRRNAT